MFELPTNAAPSRPTRRRYLTVGGLTDHDLDAFHELLPALN
jgi:hypothetical protein